MLGVLFFLAILGAGLVAPWFVRRISMLAVLAAVVLGLAVAAYLVWARDLTGYGQLKALPVIAATYAGLLALGLRTAFLVLQRRGTALSTAQKAAGLMVAFGMFAALFGMNL